ncbi:SIS domain-containing protein [Geosporobacter ferrireducens]|uniref:Phosphosugar isomerase n=1 Tax=Geosporobacter ferrireducens TaxID=1424294 RepID=A0A1D8GFZ9_9FIRM|nr:SIS domain-containing protein [Geosporobacter ferrireducens]AOT69837.1 phosphosugar isomerase [Geosporobacter ferrireducens]MTI54472.1 SIS domain-containing protein [Geosporobacter ferrireducens]
MEVKQIISEVKAKLDNIGGLKHVYFVACGGSQAAIFGGYYLLNKEAKTFGVSIFNSNEFVHATPAMLDENCICVICSLKATPETVEAVKTANKRGAVTIAMTGFPTTDMAKNGQYVVVYSNGENQIYSQGNQSNALRLGFELLKQYEDYDKYDAAMDAFTKVDQIIAKAKKYIDKISIKFAEEYKDDEIFYVMASGPAYSTAYTMSYCHFMEMQWKHAVPMHTGEYFHGPFETTDKNLPVILLMSEGSTRPLDERALKFLNRYAARVTVIDAKELGINIIDDSVAEFFNSVIMIPIERSMVAKMAELRNHSMDQRRYMWKVEY